jgi:large subunit ribosomal protein L23
MKYMDPRQVIIRPIITEKSDKSINYQNAYVFEVAPDANKIEIRKAVEAIWDVKVLSVRTLNKKGKVRRVRYKRGQTSGWKKAIVKLREGHAIDIY